MRRRDWVIILVTLLGLAVAIGACARWVFRPKAATVRDSRIVPPPPTTQPEPQDVPAVVYVEPVSEVAYPPVCPGEPGWGSLAYRRMPCAVMDDEGSLRCVLASPLDLDKFLCRTLERAERAARRERLSFEVSTPLG